MAKSMVGGTTMGALTALVLLGLVVPTGAEPREDHRAPDLGDCQVLRVPTGNKVAFRAFAVGVQIYRWNGERWVFVRPEALLFAGDADDEPVGIHYAGPTWESASGSFVVGSVLERCTPDPDAIPWLLLRATSTGGPGIFHRITYIQRVYTEGGLAPATPGAYVGQEVGVDYVADYYFYRGSR